MDAAARADVPLTAIGRMARGAGVCLRDEQGREMTVRQPGYRHF
jgi:hypothetical protein